jgi:hypothetical protein
MAYIGADIGDLVGLVLKKIDYDDYTKDVIDFTTNSGKLFRMHHFQDCCETVRVEDIIGDLDDLIGGPILTAEKRTSDASGAPDVWEYGTWTFYEFATIKGSVTIRWLGTSNGYYSESVDFVEVNGVKTSRIRSH